MRAHTMLMRAHKMTFHEVLSPVLELTLHVKIKKKFT